MSNSDTNRRDASDLDVMFVPPENDQNLYLSSLSTELEASDVTVVEYSWNSLFPLLGPIRAAGRPDVIHVHWLESLTTGPTLPRTLLKAPRLIFELTIVKLLGVSLVWTVHNLSSHDRAYPRWERLWRILLPHLVFDHLIVHCDRAKELVQEHYYLRSTSKITVIPHGHYINKYPRDSSTRSELEPLDTAEDTTVFAFFGQIRPYKQVPRLVETFREIDNDSSTLIVAGKPGTEKLQRTLLERTENRRDIHTVLEFIPNTEVAQYFEMADVFVFPYRDILTSGSVILAMSFARPVIAPDLGCLPELIEDGVTGFVYDADDPDSLQQAMERALRADLEKMGENAYKTIESFDWDSIADQTRSVYES